MQQACIYNPLCRRPDRTVSCSTSIMTLLSWSFLCLLALDSAFGAATPPPDERCQNADMFGVIEIGCWGYRECVNGAFIEHLCEEKQVLDKDTRQCHPKGTGHTDCDNGTDCTGLPDSFYSNYFDYCKSYSRCYGGNNIGQFYCPGSLIFNEEIQSCDFVSDVYPPCGTKLPETTTKSPTTAASPTTT
ncbi:unnamed protein product [Candidula unifasciata]|uniref:Chitin-binding type-2 domain-containing protein n=1 Tax=Candidula unifasciata TaxID=100452 RepID=A0A8S3ZD57_9EUPU|nr:unnamed protein product [Candidula unifasciata]